MHTNIAQAINQHEKSARIYLQLASDNSAVANSEKGLTRESLERHKEYLGYAEDYSLAHKELSKAYRLLSDELHKASLPVNK